MVNKQTLRQVFLEKRLFLSRQEYHKRNQLLLERLVTFLGSDGAGFVHIFLSMTDKNEVDTFAIIDAIKKVNPDTTIAVSKTLPRGELSHYLFNERTQIAKSRWGIPEPVEGEAAEIDRIDVVLVPLITFDKAGHRIGYGKGYYDRFLKKVPQARKIGLSLAPPLDCIAYADEMDVKLDACVSPFQVYQF